MNSKFKYIMFTYICVETQKKSEGRNIRRGVYKSIDTVTQVSIKFRKKKKRKQKDGYKYRT